METKNRYGTVSGSYIMSEMDDCALETLERDFGDDGVYLTKSAKVEFWKQCCDATKTATVVATYEDLRKPGTYVVICTFESTDASEKYAQGRFVFVKKPGTYCDGGQ